MVFRRPWRYASSSSILMNETLDQPGIGRDLLPRRQMLRSGSRHERGAMTPLSAAARIPAVLAVALTLFASCRAQRPSPPVIAASPSPYLFVWTTDADSIDLNFLAVLDARRDSPSYGRVLATLAVPTSGHTRGHHVEHRMPVGGMLFANDFGTGKTYVLDLRDPLRPAVADSFVAAGDLTSPHSFERLTNGHVLATFQNRGPGNRDVGGIAELDARGRMVRQGSAAAGDVYIRPYSLAVVPALDRVVTGSADMRGAGDSRVVQVWRLSDLTLLRTIPIPNEWGSAAEPRVLADGRTVLVATFGCSLLRIEPNQIIWRLSALQLAGDRAALGAGQGGSVGHARSCSKVRASGAGAQPSLDESHFVLVRQYRDGGRACIEVRPVTASSCKRHRSVFHHA